MRNARSMLVLMVLTLGAGCAQARAEGARLSFRDPPAPVADPGASGRTPAGQIPDRFTPEWTVQIEPTLWFVGPSGKIKLPVTSGTGPGAFTTDGDKLRINDLDMQSTRLRPAGTLTVASDKWRFAFSGSEYTLARSGVPAPTAGRLGAVPFDQGDPLRLELSFGAYELTAGYRIWSHDFTERTDRPSGAIDAAITIHLLGGVRLDDVDVGAENLSTGLRAEGSHLFFEPIIGARAEAVIDRDFSIVVQATGGAMSLYSTSSYSFDLSVAFQWRPTPNIGVQIGWRQIAFDVQDGQDLDKFQYTGRLAGLFTGIVIRF
jgi:hypothetical protein